MFNNAVQEHIDLDAHSIGPNVSLKRQRQNRTDQCNYIEEVLNERGHINTEILPFNIT